MIASDDVLMLMQDVNVPKACGHEGIGNKIINYVLKGCI